MKCSVRGGKATHMSTGMFACRAFTHGKYNKVFCLLLLSDGEERSATS